MSTFTELDALEKELGKPVTSMTDDELVAYFKLYQKIVNELDLPVTGMPERSIMAGLKRTYGPDKAGMIVKWACWQYHGKDFKGQPLTHFSFTKGQKWRTDKLYLEMQNHLNAQTAVVKDAGPGMSLRDL